MPKVSICIPTYEQVEYLKILLDSILNQNYTDFEIIITDDSKMDHVENLVKQYNFEGKLKYFRNKNRLGSPENWNEAVRKAVGKYIKIMHHDDWFTFSDSLGQFVRLLEEGSTAFAFSGTNVFYATTGKQRLHSANLEQIDRLKQNPISLLLGNIIGAPSATIFKNDIKIEFDNNLKWNVDFDFYITLLNSNNKFSYTNKPLITTVTEANHSVTNECINNKDILIFENFYVYNKYKNYITNTKIFIDFLIDILKSQKITKIKEIRNSDYTESIPITIYLYFLKLFLKKIAIKFKTPVLNNDHH